MAESSGYVFWLFWEEALEAVASRTTVRTDIAGNLLTAPILEGPESPVNGDTRRVSDRRRR